MLRIYSRIPTANLPVAKVLSRLIQSYIYCHVPPREHEGLKHASGKVFKRMNFDFSLRQGVLEIRFRAYERALEEQVALAVLKDGLKLGEIHLVDTSVAIEEHRIESDKVQLKGCIACAVQGLLGHKIYLEPQDSRHLEMLKRNAQERFETLTCKAYEGVFEMALKWQQLDKPRHFYYGNNKSPIKAWPARWEVEAAPELINVMLDTGVGSGCMNAGVGFLEVVGKG